MEMWKIFERNISEDSKIDDEKDVWLWRAKLNIVQGMLSRLTVTKKTILPTTVTSRVLIEMVELHFNFISPAKETRILAREKATSGRYKRELWQLRLNVVESVEGLKVEGRPTILLEHEKV